MAITYGSELAKKLNVKPGLALHVIARSPGVDLGALPTATATRADGVLLFVRTLAELDAVWSAMRFRPAD